MQARAAIALSMTVLLSTGYSPAFASSKSGRAAASTSSKTHSSPFPSLASAPSISPPPISPPPPSPPPPSPPPTAPPRLLPLKPLPIDVPGAAATGGNINTRVARPNANPAVNPLANPLANPLVNPPSATRVERPPSSSGGANYVPPPTAYGQPPGYNALAPVKDSYPAIGQLEQVTLGTANPQANIDNRLASLETAIFKKTYEFDSLFDRTERLKKTILGSQEVDPNSAAGREDAAAGRNSSRGTTGSDWIENPHPALESLTEVHYLDEQAALPENFQAASAAELGQFAVVLLNKERQSYGVAPVSPDNVAEKMAGDLASDLAARNLLSHFSRNGDNPDRRFTLCEGSDALNEGIASVKTSEVGTKLLCKSAVARILKTMLGRQDDRDALLNPDATHIGFAAALSNDRERVIAAVEVLSRHAIMIPVATEVAVGEKIEVRGVLQSPYIFDKVTVAWESYNPEGASSAPDESEEALPYFPPLDYIAYSSRSEGNHDKAILILKTGLIVGAVGAGLFFPPAAMAVPLIALSGSASEPKPVSDIPVKGGIKVDGGSFSGHIPLSNTNKPGLYYVTVWAMQAKGQKSVPISRRVILARAATPDEQQAAEHADERAKEEKKILERKEKEERKLKLAQEKSERHQSKAKKNSPDDNQDEKLDKRRGLDVEAEIEPSTPVPANTGNTEQFSATPDLSKSAKDQAVQRNSNDD